MSALANGFKPLQVQVGIAVVLASSSALCRSAGARQRLQECPLQ